MKRVILFDLGDASEVDEVRRPGAIDALNALQQMRDADGDPIAIAALWEGGVDKPDARVFQDAVDEVAPGVHLHRAIFITESGVRADAARACGLAAIQLRTPARAEGEVEVLADLVPLIRRYLAFDPCGKRAAKAKGRHPSRATKAKQADPAIRGIVDQIDAERMIATIRRLGDFGTRWSHAARIEEVTEWLRGEFVAAGYGGAGECRFQPFILPGAAAQRNVLASKGSSDGGIVLVCCHYDSVSELPKEAAPGADDDGSGVAAVLEMARLLAGVSLKRQVLFAAFGGEEQGLFGSGGCAEVAALERWPIEVVINLDMIGVRTSDPARVVVEYDQGNRNPDNDAAAKAFGELMAQAGADYTSLEIEHTDIWNSDYMPFEAKGYSCIGAYEGGDNAHYHKSTDTVDRVDGDYLLAVTRMVLATIISIAGLV